MNEIQVQAILKTIDVFKPEDALIEVRSFSNNKPKSGYYRDKNQMLLCIDKFPNDTWYFVMNKVKDECYSREQNEKILQGKLTTTSDKDVDGIDWILMKRESLMFLNDGRFFQLFPIKPKSRGKGVTVQNLFGRFPFKLRAFRLAFHLIAEHMPLNMGENMFCFAAWLAGKYAKVCPG